LKMKGSVLLLLVMLAALCVVAAVPDSAASMVTRARGLLDSLRAEQRAKASLPFASDERADWHFVPRARKGVPLGELDPAQRKTADALLKSGLSAQGYATSSAGTTAKHPTRNRGSVNPDPRPAYLVGRGRNACCARPCSS
jgi:hypothetical protein